MQIDVETLIEHVRQHAAAAALADARRAAAEADRQRIGERLAAALDGGGEVIPFPDLDEDRGA